MIRVAIGIDPGYRAFGCCVIARDEEQRWVAEHVETVRTPSSMPFHERCQKVFNALQLMEPGPWEGLPCHQLIVSCENQSGVHEGKRRAGGTNSDAMRVQQIVGMCRVFAYDLGARFVEPTPAQAKAVLLGIRQTASKAQVQRAVRAMVRGCPKVMSEHASDALANALAGARMVN